VETGREDPRHRRFFAGGPGESHAALGGLNDDPIQKQRLRNRNPLIRTEFVPLIGLQAFQGLALLGGKDQPMGFVALDVSATFLANSPAFDLDAIYFYWRLADLSKIAGMSR
jgi:hypothetical protein